MVVQHLVSNIWRGLWSGAVSSAGAGDCDSDFGEVAATCAALALASGTLNSEVLAD